MKGLKVENDPLQDAINNKLGTTTPVSQPQTDPLQDAINKKLSNPVAANLDAAQVMAKDKDPEASAKVLTAQKQTGLDATTLTNNPDLQKPQPPDASKVAEQAPGVAGYMGQSPDHAAALSKDVDSYVQFEKNASLYDKVDDAFKGVNNSVMNLLRGTALFARNVTHDPDEAQQSQMAADYLAKQVMPTPSDKMDWEHITNAWNRGDKNEATWAASIYAGKFIPNSLEMAIPAVGLLANVASNQANEKEQLEASGVDKKTANTESTISAIGSYILGRLVELPVIKGLAKHVVGEVTASHALEIGKSVGINLLKSVGMMYTNNFAQEGVDTFARAWAGEKDAFKDFWSRANSAGEAGAFLGGLMAGFHSMHGHTEIVDKVNAKKEVNKAQNDADLWSALNKQSDTSKLSKSNPDIHRDALQASLKSKNAETTYISVDGFKKYAESKGIDPLKAAVELGVHEQYADSDVTGNKIRVNTADLITKLAGTEHAEKLKDIISFGADGSNLQEAEQSEKDVYDRYKQPEAPKTTGVVETAKQKINDMMDKLGWKPKDEPEPVGANIPTPKTEIEPAQKPIPDNTPWPKSEAKDVLEKLEPPLPLKKEDLIRMGFSDSDSDDFIKHSTNMVVKAQDVVSDNEIDKWKKEWNDRFHELRPDVSKDYYSQPSVRSEMELKYWNKKYNKSTYDGYGKSVKENIEKPFREAGHPIDEDTKQGIDHALENKPSFTDWATYVADKNGYGSVDEMLKDINKSGTDHEKVVDSIAREQTEKSMGTRRDEISKEIRDRILDFKLDAVLKKAGEMMMKEKPGQEKKFVGKLISPSKNDKLSKEAATSDLLKTPVSSLSSEAAFKLMTKSMKESKDAWASGDRQGAVDANARARYAIQLRSRMRGAEKDMTKLLATCKNLSKGSLRDKLISVGDDHLAQLDRIRKLLGLPSGGKNPQEPRLSLNDYIDSINGYGKSVDKPETLMNRTQPADYKDLPFGEVNDAHNLIKAIIKEATEMHEVVVDGRKRQVSDFSNIIKKSKEENFPKATGEDHGKSDFEKIKSALPDGLKSIYNYHAITSYILDKIGGPNKLNDVYRFVHSGMVENSQINYSKLMAEQNAFERGLRKELGISDDEYDGWSLGTNYFPSLDTKNIPDAKFKHGGNMTPDMLVSTLLNCGSESNLKGLSAHGWTEGDLKEAFESGISDKQAKYVKAHLERLKSHYYEMADKVSQETNGYRPGKVDGKPFTFKTSDGNEHTIEGYFPTQNKGFVKKVEDTKGPIGDKFNSKYSKPKTNQDHLKQRTGEGTYAPTLRLRVLNEYMRSSIHDASYRETVIGLNRIFGDEGVRSDITDMIGKGSMENIDNWIHDIAIKSQPTGDDFYDRHVLPLVSNMVTAALGLNLSPVLEHLNSLSNASYEIGPRIIPAALRMGPDALINGAKKISGGLEHVFHPDITKNIQKAFDEIGDNRAVNTLQRWSGHLPSLSNDFTFISNSDPYMIDEFKRGFGEFEMDETIGGQKSYINKMLNHGSFGASSAFIKSSFMALRTMDMLNKAAIWKSTYDRAITGGYKDIEKGDHESSVLLARKNVKQLKGSQYSEDLPQVLKSKMMRPFNSFMRPFVLGLNQSVRAIGGYKTVSDYILKGSALVATLSLIPTLWQQKSKGEHIPDLTSVHGWDYELQKMAIYQSQSVVILRSLATLYEKREMEGKSGIDMDIMPTQRMATEMATGLGDLVAGTTHGRLSQATSDKAVDGLGYALGLSTPHLLKFMDKYLK